MSEDRESRTEEASGKRLDREKSKGNVAYSKEVAAAALLLSFVALLRAFGGDFTKPILASLRSALSLEDAHLATREGVFALAARVALPALIPAAAGLFLAAIVVAAAGFGQVGFSISSERVSLKFERLNPIAGFGRIFNTGSFGTLGTGLLKIVVVGWLAWDELYEIARSFAAAPVASVAEGSDTVLDAALSLASRIGIFLAVYAATDTLWRRFSYKKNLRMTKQEVKDEHKQDEGDGTVKAEIKRRMKEIARQQMVRDVKNADVVVRNPTHFAVALRYDRKKEHAPRVIAKGADGLALRIIAEAERAKVPVVSKPEVARELYRVVRLGEVIPPALYKAAATLLAYVARRKKKRAA